MNVHRTDPTKWDADGDGMPDGAEVIAGTDPHSAASVFKITNVQRHPDGSVVLQWSSVTNKLYRLNRSLTPSRDSFTTWTDAMPGAPPLNTFTDTTATNDTASYWVALQ